MAKTLSISQKKLFNDVQFFGINPNMNKIGCLATIRRIQGNSHNYMCNAAIISMTRVLTVRICIHQIPIIGYEKFSVWVGEGLEGPYTAEARAKGIEHICFDEDSGDPDTSELALVIVSYSILIKSIEVKTI